MYELVFVVAVCWVMCFVASLCRDEEVRRRSPNVSWMSTGLRRWYAKLLGGGGGEGGTSDGASHARTHTHTHTHTHTRDCIH